MQSSQPENRHLSFDDVQTLDESSIHTFIALKKQELSMLNDRLKVIQDAKVAKANAQYLKQREIEIAKQQAAMLAQIDNEKRMLNFNFKIEQSTPARVIRATVFIRDENFKIIGYDGSRNEINHISQVECESEPKFGDILDFTGYRHYDWMFVGKDGKLLPPSGNYDCHPFADNIECGVVVPAEICKYLEDPWKKYSSNKCVQAYELPYNSKIVQTYKNVPKDSLYVYEMDYDNTYDWQLYAYQPGSKKLVIKY